MFYVPDLALRYKKPIHKFKGRVTLKKMVPFLSPALQQKVTWAAGKSFFFTLFETNITFYFKFLPFLRRTSIQKWKENGFCYVHKWIGKNEILAKTSKCLCRNLFIGATAQIRAMYKDYKILVTLKRWNPLSLSF